MNDELLSHSHRELSILNTIAHQLNREVELRKALTVTLRHTVELLGLRTGWIWLVRAADNTVYLAASHNLPPAFTQHPERLSGWCYCIDKYLANNLENTTNISEITCSRLENLDVGTAGLRYHASVPLTIGDEKIGIMNVVSEQSQELHPDKLQLLHTIGDLLSMAVQRTRRYEDSRQTGAREERDRLARRLSASLLPELERLTTKLQLARSQHHHREDRALLVSLEEAARLAETIKGLADHSLRELHQAAEHAPSKPRLQYPQTPLSEREREVLDLLRAGNTNKQIAATLFISERTVKFHVSAILQKLGAGNRTEAVRLAVERGVLER